MAEKLDVTSRLAEGRPAVDNLQTYVLACHMLGYADADLTLHAAQVRDWYGSEDGLDLRALDADCAALKAAAAATADALTRQADQLGALSAAWQGGSAELSREFLRRHGDASAAAAAAVRTAADTLVALRDNLWHTVDGKVAAAMAADDRAPDEWLAAARTVTTGVGDRAAASERIDREVKPFVDNDIRTEWVAAMRSAMAAVVDCYDAATAELTAEPDAVFDVPGDLGPAWTPQPHDAGVVTVPAAAVPAPAGVTAPPVAASPVWSAPPMPAPAAPMPAPAAPPVDAGMLAPAMAAPPSPPSFGGMPDVGGGLSGFGQQLADAFGSLLGSADEALTDTPAIDEPDVDEDLDDKPDDDELDNDELDEDLDEDELDDAGDEPVGDEPVDPAADPELEPPAEEAVEPTAAEVGDTCVPAEAAVQPPPDEPTPTPVPPPPVEPAPLAQPAPEPMAATQTPCEIAADELPQAGR